MILVIWSLHSTVNSYGQPWLVNRSVSRLDESNKLEDPNQTNKIGSDN